jgi:hypothetical protein
MKLEQNSFYVHKDLSRRLHTFNSIDTISFGDCLMAEELDTRGVPVPRLMHIPEGFNSDEWEKTSEEDFYLHYDKEEAAYMEGDQTQLKTLEQLYIEWGKTLYSILDSKTKSAMINSIHAEIKRIQELLKQ